MLNILLIDDWLLNNKVIEQDSSEYFEDMFKMIDKNNSNLKTSINIFNPSDEGVNRTGKL